ncbi:hypothetical protein D3C76_1125230 [compost metagenome]
MRLEGFHGDDLADGQMSAAGGHTVFADRYVVGKVHLHAVDADRGEAGDGTDDTRPPHTAGLLLDRRAGATHPTVLAVDARTADTTRALLGWCACAADATLIAAHAGAAHTARKLHRRRAAHAHLISANARRRSLHERGKPQTQCKAQNEGDDTKTAQVGHGSGGVGELGSVGSV